MLGQFLLQEIMTTDELTSAFQAAHRAFWFIGRIFNKTVAICLIICEKSRHK